MHRFSVTNRQYLMFLDDLVVQGRQNEALRHAPRERPGAANEEGALVYHFDGSRFSLQVDADGDAWQEEWPVLQVDWYGAGAYLDWLAERSGRPWRLPDEREWEKAARGVDGRWFPWGDHFDPSWCHTNQSHRSRRLPAVVDSYPEDVSPTGVRGLGGNTEDWCLNHFDPAPVFAGPVVTPPQDPPALCTDTLTVVRGGAWFITATSARSADRGRVEPNGRYSFLGFRGVYRPRLG